MAKYLGGIITNDIHLSRIYKDGHLLVIPEITSTDTLCTTEAMQTLSNKTLDGCVLRGCRLDKSNRIYTTGGHTLTFPLGLSGTLACLGGKQTFRSKMLLNCTLDDCRIGSLISANGSSITIPTGDSMSTTVSLVTTNTQQTLTNKTLVDPIIDSFRVGDSIIRMPTKCLGGAHLLTTSGSNEMSGVFASAKLSLDFSSGSITMMDGSMSLSALEMRASSIRMSDTSSILFGSYSISMQNDQLHIAAVPTGGLAQSLSIDWHTSHIMLDRTTLSFTNTNPSPYENTPTRAITIGAQHFISYTDSELIINDRIFVPADPAKPVRIAGPIRHKVISPIIDDENPTFVVSDNSSCIVCSGHASLHTRTLVLPEQPGRMFFVENDSEDALACHGSVIVPHGTGTFVCTKKIFRVGS